MNPHIFRAYDIRGLVTEDLTRQVVEGIGRAYATLVGEAGGTRVGVGMDVRDTSPPLEAALIRGITRSGVDVERLGTVPTPAVYFAVHHRRLDGAVQVTGSHNPVTFNGFKMMLGRESLHGDRIQELRRRIESGKLAQGRGQIHDAPIEAAYLDALAEGVSLARPLKVVIDAGNGCAWRLGPELFRRLGCEVEELYCTPDGSFPNHIPDPTLPETLVTLRDRVLAGGADLGLAFDGDADRLGAMDETGGIAWGDQLLALFARQVLAGQPGASVLFEVKCSQALIEDIAAHGGKPVMVPTGHSLIKKAMRETGAPLAGEMSGHLFFADRWFGFDDGLYAAARLAELVAGLDHPLSQAVASLPQYSATPEMRLTCDDQRKFDVVTSVLERYRSSHDVNDVDGARIEFGDGWGLVRASNTQPVVVLRAEGTTPEIRDRIRDELVAVLAEHGVLPE